jgi:hypothetical protein
MIIKKKIKITRSSSSTTGLAGCFEDAASLFESAPISFTGVFLFCSNVLDDSVFFHLPFF